VKHLLPESHLNFLLAPLAHCKICPRNCGVDRLKGETGFCGGGSGFDISSICLHLGEEPAIVGDKGICNVFFSHCNLSCIYCQNYQISSKHIEKPVSRKQFYEVINSIAKLLDSGCKAVGFVSPSHFILQVKIIIEELRLHGYNPIFVYNTNGYDKVEEIRLLEKYINIYLPDYKYSDNNLARKLSKVANYKQTALLAIKEMYRQKGTTLIVNENGYAENGLIIRHLVLPGHIENSLGVFRDIADISTSIAVSLMAQYFPTPAMKHHATLNRTLTAEEYETVKNELEYLGFYKGWVQELESNESYRPDFESDKPFMEQF
jgi:putative pyruvate formate lyase activating enzyme